MGYRLNLGCGSNAREGFLNVDVHPGLGVDVVWNLEYIPWQLIAHEEIVVGPDGFTRNAPKILPDSSVDEVVMNHVLEHIGQDPRVFLRFMQELYRVCRHGAQIHIAVPHPRHDDFLGDPTHVRPIIPQTIELFSKRANEYWKKQGAANSLFAFQYNVDFQIVELEMIAERVDVGGIDLKHYNNTLKEIRMLVVVLK